MTLAFTKGRVDVGMGHTQKMFTPPHQVRLIPINTDVNSGSYHLFIRKERNNKLAVVNSVFHTFWSET